MRRTSLAVTVGAIVALTASSCSDTTEPASNGDETSAEGLFDELDAELLEQVPEAYRDAEDQWVGLSGRVRTLIYNTDTVDEADLPTSVDELTGPDYSGRVGVAPTNASFQSFVTAHREVEGEEETQTFLDDLAGNDPQIREGNGEIVTDVADGVIEMGLVNHYYLYSRAKELGEDPSALNVANHLFSDGDVGSLVNVAGLGVLNSENESSAALAEFMLSTEGQTYFAEETAEYPMIEGVDGPEDMPSLEELDAPDIDLNQLDDLETSVEMIVESGLVG